MTLSDPLSRTPRIVHFYEQYLVDRDASRFAEQVKDDYSVATLERLVEANSRISRRAAVLAIGLVGDYTSNFVLGRALVDEDRGVRALAETSIRNLWTKAGSPEHRAQLELVMCLNESRRYEDAIRLATRLINESPWLAEAWNQRGLARFNCGQFEDAIRDCHQTLEINPYHFAAAAGMGKCYLKLNHRTAALEAFRRALRLNPGLDDVRAQVVFLQRALKKEE